MALSNLNDFSIVELIGYIPAFIFSIFLCIRHGFGPNKGWIFLLIFSLIRIVGASLELATISNPTSISLVTAAVTLSSIGLSPLLLTSLGLLYRVSKNINKESPSLIRTMHIRLLRIPITVALVLILSGSESSASYLTKHGTYPIEPTTRIGVVLLIVVFVAVVFITAVFMAQRMHAEAGERRLIYAMTASIPSILIRLIYVVLIMFSNLAMFSVIHPSVVAIGCMAIMQEFIVVFIYIGVGLTLPLKVKKSPVEADGREEEMGAAQ